MYQVNTRGGWRRSALTLCCAAVLSVLLTPQAHAAFVDAYALSNFTLTNTTTCPGFDMPNGFVTGSPDGLSLVLTGSNSGSGCAGTTDLTINAASSGVVQFDYSYSSLDFPGYDWAAYLLAGLPIQLTDGDPPLSGTVTFQVTAGESFGFRVATADNEGEPGVFAISNFSAPSGVSPVPEPGALQLAALGGFAAVILCHNLRKEARA